MIRVFDPEGVCIEEYRSWEDAARALLKTLNEVEHENYTIMTAEVSTHIWAYGSSSIGEEEE